MVDFVETLAIGIITALIPWPIRRWAKRRRALRELEQLRHYVEQCALIYVADTQHGSSERGRLLPAESPLAIISRLHSEGFLTGEQIELLQQFFGPAQQANALLVAPQQGGPPALNLARRAAVLIQGRGYVQGRDGNGFTVRERVEAALAEAISQIKGTI